MKLMSIQEAYERKFRRQRQIKQLQYHASGHCVHIGKISPGCYSCFVGGTHSKNLYVGPKCNLNCPYCASNKNDVPLNKKILKRKKILMLRESCQPGYSLLKVSFSGGGETLCYLDKVKEYLRFFKDMEKYLRKKPWYYLYTNGVLADNAILLELKNLGFDEIRFHLGASNFSADVYRNMEMAVGYFKAVTVETPAWPFHRERLFEMLPIIEDIGVKHLNVGEIEINEFNYATISHLLPKAKIYQCYETHLYDEGLVYDIMEEVLNKNYSYSVLDCSCFVKNIQRSPAKRVCWAEGEEGKICASYV